MAKNSHLLATNPKGTLPDLSPLEHSIGRNVTQTPKPTQVGPIVIPQSWTHQAI